MRVHFSTSWIFQGWITHLILTLCAQKTLSRPTCVPHEYLKDKKCCRKCEPDVVLAEEEPRYGSGKPSKMNIDAIMKNRSYVFTECFGSTDTVCRPCGRNDYQPDWTNETKCLPQKFCDTGKGFNSVRPVNPLAPAPCQCKPGRQCSPINCEFCEKIPTCGPGHGLVTDPESGRKSCVACKRGYFSPNSSMESCRQWTNCKALGKSEKQAGSERSDAMCGPPLSGPSTSWVVVSVLSVITVLSLLILLLFCYKDKLKLLSVNLRSCVQNLKRTRIQQDTLAPLYHSGGGGGGGGAGQSLSLCETSCLIRQDHHTPTEPSRTCPPISDGVKLPLPPPTEETRQEERMKETGEEKKKAEEDERSAGSGEAEEVSEEEEEEECVSPLWAGSCMCVSVCVREPLEVGENEDCSQAVSPGPLGSCSCGGVEGERGEVGKSQTGVPTLSLPISPALRQTFSPLSSATPPCDLCLPLTQARSEVGGPLIDRSLRKGEGLYKLNGSIGSVPTPEAPPTSTPTATSPDPSVTPVSVDERCSEPSSEASREKRDQGLSWGDSGGNKLSSGDSELECAPESLQSQLAEPALTSGQVTGNHNTTFISSGQVMNFSGDVIVVYVSQTSLSNEGVGPDDAFGSPVQEQANESASLFLSLPSKSPSSPTPGNSITHNPPRDDNLPVQEVTDEWPREK